MKQLPVFGTIADAYRFVWENRQDFLLIAFLPVVIGAVAQTLLLGFLSPDVPVEPPPDAEAQGTSGPGVAVLLNLLVSIVLYVMFSVAWHRMFLAQEQTTVGAALRWGPRQMRFLARFALLVLLTAAVGLAFGGLATLGAVATAGAGPSPLQALAFMGAIMVVSLVAARLFLILPAAALDEQMTLQESWRLTQGNSWRMVGISFLPPIPIWIAWIIVSAPLQGAVGGLSLDESLTAILVVGLVEQFFLFASVAVTVSALSIAYREFKPTSGTNPLVASQ